MPILAYRAKQSTDTSGTGTLVLNAAASNARSFEAAFGVSSRRVQYVISWATGFEIGLGDFDGGNPGSLTRATVLASSNANALVTLPAGTKDVFTAFDPAAHEVVSIAGTATLALADVGNTVVFTGSSAATLNFPAVATVPIGAGFMVLNQGTAALTLDPNGAETINGSPTLVLQAGGMAFVRRVSGTWYAGVFSASVLGLALIGAISAGAAFDIMSSPSVSVASAATTALGAANSDKVVITGTTTITSFGTVADGRMRQIRFAGALTLTHNATSLILPGAQNITTAAGDTALAFSEGSGNWRVVAFQKANGLPVIVPATLQTLSSGSDAAPAHSFSGDPNTGAYNPGADRYAISTNGVRRLEITATGDLQFNNGYGSVATAFGVRAWVNFNGTGAVAIRASGNVTSITDNGTGDYTINFTNAMPDADYAVLGTVQGVSGAHIAQLVAPHHSHAPTTSSLRILTGGLSSLPDDRERICVAVVR